MLRLRLLLSLLVRLDEGALDVVPWEPDAAVPAFMPGSYRSEFRRMLSFIIDLFPQAANSPSIPSPRDLFEDFFAPALVPPQPIHLALFCVSILVSVVLLPRSDLRFPSQRGLPLGRVRVCCVLSLSRFSGLLHAVVSILYRSPFHSSDSFASMVPLAT